MQLEFKLGAMQGEQSDNILGSKIKATRKQLGLSQEALAEKANVSLSTIQRIEKGTVQPRPFTVNVLTEILNIDTISLYQTPEAKESSPHYFSALKRINFAALLLVFFPLINLVLPIVLWRKYKQDLSQDSDPAGKIISFHFLWGILTIITMVLSVFVFNFVTGEAGDGLYILFIVYAVAVFYNIYIIIKTATELSAKNKNILSFIPNLF